MKKWYVMYVPYYSDTTLNSYLQVLTNLGIQTKDIIMNSKNHLVLHYYCDSTNYDNFQESIKNMVQVGS